MVRVRLAAVFVAALLAVAPVDAQGATQAGAPTESLSDLLLKQAQTALDAFDRPSAQRFARQVLEQMATASAAQKQKARVILANVFYPEEAPNERKRQEALAILKEAVRDDFDITLDRALTWPGLDSILVEAKATTFGIAAAAAPQQDALGPDGHIDFTARASRPSFFSVTIRGPQLNVVVNDSVGGAEATLKVATMRNERPVFTTGKYDITVTAVDKATRDSVSSRFSADVWAPELAFANIPTALDSSRIRPERTKKYGFKGIVVGAFVGGSIYGLANILHADTTLKRSGGADAKGNGIAVIAGTAVVLASFFDNGRSIPSAIALNQRLRDDFAASIRTAHAENANRITTYKTTFVITPGGR